MTEQGAPRTRRGRATLSLAALMAVAMVCVAGCSREPTAEPESSESGEAASSESETSTPSSPLDPGSSNSTTITAVSAESTSTTSSTSTSVAPQASAQSLPPVVAAGPPDAAKPPAAPAPATPTPATSPGGRDIAAFRGIGTWGDVYDWSPSSTGGNPSVKPADVDAMARAGVTTLYLQSARTSSSSDLNDPAVFGDFVRRAHAKSMKVVAWYLPQHSDPAKDLRRLKAAANSGADAIGVDIEGTAIADPVLRSQRLIELSAQLRAAVTIPIGAIVYSPLGLELKPTTWPAFPWREIAKDYDVWLPMGYWTARRSETPEWDNGERYTDYNFVKLREWLGDSKAAIHTIGGLGGQLLPGQVDGMVRSIRRNGGIGGSLYGWADLTDGDKTALSKLTA